MKPVLPLKWKITAKKAALEKDLCVLVDHKLNKSQQCALAAKMANLHPGLYHRLEVASGGSSCPPPFNQGHLEQIVQDHVRLSFEYLRGWGGTPQPLWATYCCISKSIASRSREVISVPYVSLLPPPPPNPSALNKLHLEHCVQFWIPQDERC